MKLPSDKQIKRVLDLLRSEGLPIARVDILTTGVSVSSIAPAAPAGNAYDAWKEQDHDGAAHRSQAA